MWAVGEHQLQAASHTAYNSTLGKLLNTEDRQVRYRLGIIGGDQTIWTGWTTGRVTVCRADVSRINKSGDGFAFSIRICDQLVRLNQENKVKARRGKISDIIQQIAVENGITDFSIEPTAGIYNMVQSYETDFDFMLRITAMAVNASGIGGYTFYLVNDILHFHTNPWQTQGIKVLRANSDPEAPLWSVQFTDQVQAAIDGGGAKSGGVQLQFSNLAVSASGAQGENGIDGVYILVTDDTDRRLAEDAALRAKLEAFRAAQTEAARAMILPPVGSA